jgi:hypothetical protein
MSGRLAVFFHSSRWAVPLWFAQEKQEGPPTPLASSYDAKMDKPY